MAWRDIAARVDRAAAKPFEVDVQYTSDPSGTPVVVDVRGVFDEAGERAQFGGGEVITTQPMVGLHVDDLPSGAPEKEDLVLISGTYYAVESWDIDGPGVGVTVWLIATA